MKPSYFRALFLALSFFLSNFLSAPAALAYSSLKGDSVIEYDALPKEAQTTLQLILKGGPFPYKEKDGTTFSNREGVLPKQPRGYYKEYTVKTAATRDRGPKRIVAGSGKKNDVQTSGEYYYTDDHYASFKRIQNPPKPKE